MRRAASTDPSAAPRLRAPDRARLLQWVREGLFARPEANFAPLDGLRAIGVITILCFHCALYGGLLTSEALARLPLGFAQRVFAGGWIGIDIFFVLSGFLIGRILFAQLARGSISFKAFYIRRTCRIFPAYYLVLTLSAFLFARLDTFRLLYWNNPWDALLSGSWANYLYVSNYVYGRIPNVLPWGWSLCVEEHFYLFLPAFLALLFRQVAGRGRVAALVACATLPLVARAIAFAERPDLVVLDGPYYDTHTHFDGLLLGVLVAYGHIFHRTGMARLSTRLGPLLWMLGLACLAAVFLWGGLERRGAFCAIFQFAVLAVGATLLLINGLYLQNRVARILGHAFWYPVARISYGIYLVHPFALFWVLRQWPGGQAGVVTSVAALLAFSTAVFSVSFACAALLFLALERPMLEHGARLARRYAASG